MHFLKTEDKLAMTNTFRVALDCNCGGDYPKIVAMDVDRDSALDVLIYDGLSPEVIILLNNDPSAGIHESSTMFDMETASTVWSSDDNSHDFVNMAVLDVTHDGNSDVLVWSFSESETVVSLLRNGMFVGLVCRNLICHNGVSECMRCAVLGVFCAFCELVNTVIIAKYFTFVSLCTLIHQLLWD